MTHIGTDRHRSLVITVDADRRVRDVEISNLGRLRRTDAFVDAVQEAFAAADGARRLALLAERGEAEQLLARAEETLAGRSPATAPPPPDVSREASAARRRAGTTLLERPPEPPPVTSDNGYLTIQRGADGRLRRVSVDAAWLSGARPEHLRQALVQAFRLDQGPTR